MSDQGNIVKYSNYKGRPPGSLNKTTKLKNRFLIAFNKLEKNEETNLYTWAKKNQSDFYKLVAKMLPKTLEASLDLSIKEPIVIIRSNSDQKKEN